MPISDKQERWDVYVATGTKAAVRHVLAPGESLSQFVRDAVEAEVTRREEEAAA